MRTICFFTRKNETWMKFCDSPVPDRIRSNPIAGLKSKGYNLVNKLQDGDVVVYLSKKNKKGNQKALHFGIWGNKRVTSKFEESDIYHHTLEDVPFEYGDEVIFFRK